MLPNGALLLTAGRPGVDLFVSPDGFGRKWTRYSLPTFHNQLVSTQKEDPDWQFCKAYEEAAANHTFQDDAHHGCAIFRFDFTRHRAVTLTYMYV